MSEMLFSKSDQAAICAATLAASSSLLAISVETENLSKACVYTRENVHSCT